LREDEEELYSAPPASDPAPLYEHCVRALRAGATRGAHGLPTMRACDWNDGMNRVGAEGRGESVWLAWFLARTLQDFSVLAQDRGDEGCVRWCAEEVERLRSAIEAHAWDGEWYRRATFDDGTPLGSRSSAECKIDAIAQSWAVIAGIGDPARAARAVRASEQHLVSEELALMKLLDPPFEHTVPNPGYIQAYPPGIRENGGQYTHGVLWTLQALTLLGEAERAGALLGKLNPITHGATREIVERYRVEPYVVAADVYSSAEHGGRGGWTWYTGSAGWMYRIIVENVLGVQRRGRELLLAPCVPSGWRSFSVRYRYGAATYDLRFENPLGRASRVSRLEVDGVLASGSSVPLVDDGRVHQVRVTLGELSA
jgi:cellobiose phosphorylase